MARVEEEARRHGRLLLVLDTVPGENGHRLYLRAGWTQTGLVPDYALFPDGRLCDTAIMWKRLEHYTLLSAEALARGSCSNSSINLHPYTGISAFPLGQLPSRSLLACG